MTVAVVRRNILADAAPLQGFAEGVNLLKEDFSAGVTTQTLGFGGTPIPISAYDQFVIWHFVAMNTPTPDDPVLNPRDRNAAHRGSIFLPWHRFMLRLLELHLQRVLQDETFGLPYWDWAVPEGTPPSEQVNSALWRETGIGGSGIPVKTGPFGFPDDPAQRRFRVFFAQDVQTDRLTFSPRAGGYGANSESISRSAACPPRRRSPRCWTLRMCMTSPIGTPLLVGSAAIWKAGGWTLRHALRACTTGSMSGSGGDMGPGTSPNDPVFYLNHCNVTASGKHGWSSTGGHTCRWRPHRERPRGTG